VRLAAGQGVTIIGNRMDTAPIAVDFAGGSPDAVIRSALVSGNDLQGTVTGTDRVLALTMLANDGEPTQMIGRRAVAIAHGDFGDGRQAPINLGPAVDPAQPQVGDIWIGTDGHIHAHLPELGTRQLDN
jgi:hypothetical protein